MGNRDVATIQPNQSYVTIYFEPHTVTAVDESVERGGILVK